MGRKVITAADLEQMTPAERSAAFEASIVWDLDDAPESLVTRAREWVGKRISEDEHQPKNQPESHGAENNQANMTSAA